LTSLIASASPHLSAQINLITLNINGVSQTFSVALNAAELLAQLGYAGKRVALERNGEIVPRSTYATVQLADGDKLEVVVAVGGG
jgi:sulfur carrier protein